MQYAGQTDRQASHCRHFSGVRRKRLKSAPVMIGADAQQLAKMAKSLCLASVANRETSFDGVGEHIGQVTGEYGVLHTVPPLGGQQICMILFEQG